MPENTDTEQEVKGPLKGEFVPPPEIVDADERADALPEQEDFWRPPVRFGSVPVEKEPLGWDRRRGFRKLYPLVSLPTQVVERVAFGYPQLEPNRLFWGDNLHVMRQLPSESIDLIYIDPPFFSGRQYNVIFGDQNELRSFSDIWEGGMPGYLIWFNARLLEMKRLLKKTGSIFVHLDWHASHYLKVEMDKILGYKNFVNEVVWCYEDVGGKSTNYFKRKHDVLLFYQKTEDRSPFNIQYKALSESTIKRYKPYFNSDGKLTYRRLLETNPGVFKKLKGIPENLDDVWLDMNKGQPQSDWWSDISTIKRGFNESIGYPTQKPGKLLERIIYACSPEDGVVADFFCGGGTTPEIAQRLKRKWIACDQSRVAVALTADRISRLIEQEIGTIFAVPDFTVEHWGIYEVDRLSKMPTYQFREFILRAFGAVPDYSSPHIYGYKGAIPVWVGEPSQRSQVSAKEVEDFANSVRHTVRYQQDNLRDGIMLAWAFRPDAMKAAEHLRQMEQTDLNFIRLEQIRIDSSRFREHVAALSTDNADYANFLTFIQPPRVEVGWKRIAIRTYKFDVTETVVLNPGAKIINVQWDFDYGKRFSSTPGYSFIRGTKKEPVLQVQYYFPDTGKFHIACKVQDDMGGEGIWAGEIEVT